MDFAAESNAFLDWNETNPLEPTTQLLWFHLMVIANKSGYPEWFTVKNPLLQAKVGITENTLIKHRNYLIQSGRIEYKSMGKQKAGKYKMVSLTSKNEVNHAAKQEVKGEVNHAAKGSAFLKDFKGSSTSTNPESFYAAYQRVFGHQLTPFQSEQLGQYIDKDGMDECVVIRALERAGSSASGRYRGYFSLVTKILDDYVSAGVRTLEQAQAFDEQFDQSLPSPPPEKGNIRSGGKGNVYQREMDELKRDKEEAMRRAGIPVN